MAIITIASSKGGAVKTTTTQLLAANLAALGYRTGVVDADPNAGFSDWHRDVYQGPPIDVFAETEEEPLADRLIALDETHDVVLVDTAGFGNRLALLAITAADGVIIPCQTGRGDLVQTAATASRVKAAVASARRPIPFRVLLTRTKKTVLARHVAEELDKGGLARFANSISDLVSYQELSFTGRVPTSGREGLEIDRIIGELTDLGWIVAPDKKRKIAHS